MNLAIAQAIFVLGTIPFIALGSLHAVFTCIDQRRPYRISPSDPAVRSAMQRSRLKIHPSSNLWQAWIGFNYSHSFGAMLYGIVFMILATDDFPRLTSSVSLMSIAIVIPLTYTWLAWSFWFITPAIGVTFSSACMLVSSLLVWYQK